MRRQAGWVIALSALALVCAAWVSTAAYLPALRGAVRSDDLPPTDPSKLPRPGTPDARDTDRFARLPGWLDVVLTSLLVVLALALLAIVARASLQHRRRRRALVLLSEQETEALNGDEGALSARLARSAGESLARLHEGDPRNAIVRCWVDLEETVEAAGLPRDPALTSEEFTAGVLLAYAVTPATIAELGRLYREARFSEHRLEETHRDRAVRALVTLRDELGRGEPVSAPGTTGVESP